MKKLYLVAMASCLGMLNMEAQVKFSDVPKIGDTYTMHVFDASGMAVGGAGKDQTWDFSTLNYQDTFDFEVVDPKKEPEGNNFSSADIAVIRYSIGASKISAYNTHYYKTGSSTLTKIGRVDKTRPTGGTIIYINKFGDEEIQMKFPMEFGAKNLDAWNGGYNTSTGMTTWSAGQNDYEVDAIGKLVLPSRIIYDVLRVKRTRKYIRTKGSSTGVVERKLHEWYVPTIPFPIFAIVEEVNSGGGANRYIGYAMAAEELKDLKEPSTGTTEFASLSNRVTVFPNPTNDRLTVKLEGETLREITVIDLTGKTVMAIPGTIDSHSATLNLEGLSSGAYYLRIVAGDDNILNHKVIVDSH
ncbi:MAG: hypothetical protein CL840_21805 [Crocinitomicaceae bacterium]|nr:hypothetical protein [Crocinitomicaceae bacterium]|tara:strand:- start:21656 stop:22723 length:1068 start_codon:yes stop_codon:yes gene_type:complete